MSFQPIETMRWERSKGVVRLNFHLDRLANSINYFSQFKALEINDIQSELDELIKSNPAFQTNDQLVIRLAVSKDGAIEWSTRNVPDRPQGPVNVVIDTEPIPMDNIDYLVNKTTLRKVYDDARKRNNVNGNYEGIFDVILFNEEGEITETSIMNIAVLPKGSEEWITPPISCGCLPGIKRRELIELGHVREKVITKDELIQFVQTGGIVKIFNSVREEYQVNIIFQN